MLNDAYERLFERFGPQNWWPGESQLEVIVGAVLTQNTNWRNVETAIENLRRADLLSLKSLHTADDETIQNAIRPSGYYRLKTQRLKNLLDFIVATHGSVGAMFGQPLPALREQLLAVNGIGPETADSILLYAGDLPTFVIDAYTGRIAKRHGWVPLDADYQTMKELFESQLVRDAAKFNEYHALIVRVGKEFCKPAPECEGCPLQHMLPATGIIDFPRQNR